MAGPSAAALADNCCPRKGLKQLSMSDTEDFIPIKSSFIGGAERARRNARKRKFQPRSNINGDSSSMVHHRHESLQPYPKTMKEYERFFGSLLSSSTLDVLRSETNGNSHRLVIQQACSLINVPCLPTPPHLQQRKQVDARTHHLMQRSSSSNTNAFYMNAFPRSGTYDSARCESELRCRDPIIIIFLSSLTHTIFMMPDSLPLSLQFSLLHVFSTVDTGRKPVHTCRCP
jgi:hypothetical protein